MSIIEFYYRYYLHPKSYIDKIYWCDSVHRYKMCIGWTTNCLIKNDDVSANILDDGGDGKYFIIQKENEWILEAEREEKKKYI